MFLNVLHILKKGFALSLLYLLIMNNLVVPLYLEKGKKCGKFSSSIFLFFIRTFGLKVSVKFYSLTVSNIIHKEPVNFGSDWAVLRCPYDVLITHSLVS